MGAGAGAMGGGEWGGGGHLDKGVHLDEGWCGGELYTACHVWLEGGGVIEIKG